MYLFVDTLDLIDYHSVNALVNNKFDESFVAYPCLKVGMPVALFRCSLCSDTYVHFQLAITVKIGTCSRHCKYREQDSWDSKT